MLERIKFWWSGPSWTYSREGIGQARERYYPWSDTLLVRTSQFGYVTGNQIVTRPAFLTDCAAAKLNS
jgi:hypothetical protein